MESSTASVKQTAENTDKKIEYPNFCQSFHIGFNNYSTLKMDSAFKPVYKSQDDVLQYEQFFKSLGYHKVETLKDQKIK